MNEPSGSSAPILAFEEVHKAYPGGRDVLCGVSFEIQAGEMVLLTGPSGAGKTTLLRLAAAIERPTRGAIHVNGERVDRMSAKAIPYLRRNLGLVFQDQRILFRRTVLENVLLPLQVIGFPYADAAKRARAALERVGLLDRESIRPAALSGGEQQRLCIARAVVGRPSILIADVPTASLDAAYAESIYELFRSFNRVGVTVLVASHDAAAYGFATRRLMLAEGRVRT